MATVLDELLVKLGFDADVSGAERFNNSINKTIGIAAKVGTALGALGTIAGGALVKGVVDISASFERFETQLTVLEGSSEKAKESMAWITDFASNTPFQLDEVTGAFAKLRAYGLDPIRGDFLASIGDAAAIMGKSIDQGVEAIADAVTGENERLKEFAGIKASVDGDKVTYRYSHQGKSIEKEVANNAEAIQEALQEIFAERFGGGTEMLANTWEGMTAKMLDKWTIFKKKIGEAGIFDKLKGRLKTILDYFDDNADKVDAFAEAIGKKLVEAFDWLDEILFRVWDSALYVRDAFIELDKKFNVTEKLTKALAIGLALVAANLATLAAAKFLGALKSIRAGLSMLLSPVTLAGIAIIALALVIEDIYGFLNGKDSVIGGLLKDYPALQTVIDLAKQIFNAIKRIWTDNQETFKELFNAVMGLIDAFKPLVMLLIDILPDAFAYLLDIAVLAIEGISLAVGVLVKFFTGFVKVLTVIWKGLWSLLSSIFDGFFDGVMNRVKAIINAIRSVVKGLHSIVNGNIISGLATIGEGVVKGVGGVITGSSGGYSGKNAVNNNNVSSYQNQSNITQHINVKSAQEASLIASRTAQSTRQLNMGYM